jgi:hypothetical protein
MNDKILFAMGFAIVGLAIAPANLHKIRRAFLVPG